MKVLLIDVDSKIPNIALGKLSTYHKKQGDICTLIRLKLTGYPSTVKPKKVDARDYDTVYASNIFTINQRKFSVAGCDRVIIGGVGSIEPKKQLPPSVLSEEVDYGMYPGNDTSYGFITRGCPRKCSFCAVPKVEGELYLQSSIDAIVRHDKVSFMDNNILAYSEHKKVFKDLISRNIRCEFNQGLDIRLIDEENAELLSELRWMNEYIFAFDDIRYLSTIKKKLKIVKRYIPKPWKIKFFIYHNAVTTSLTDTVFRIEWCKNNNCLPYLMRDSNCWESEDRDFLIDLAAYCNQPSIFKKMNFYQFLNKRQIAGSISRKRVENSYTKYIQDLIGEE